jgi:hypothetical protein
MSMRYFVGLIVIISILAIFTVQSVLAQANITTGSNQSGNDVPSNNLASQFTPVIIAAIITFFAGVFAATMKGRQDKAIEFQKHENNLKVDLEKYKINLKAEYDLDLRTKRIEAYKELWSDQYLLRRHSKANITCVDLVGLVRSLTHWYYKTGGMFLTETSQKYFGRFLEELEDIIKDIKQEDHTIPLEELEKIRQENKLKYNNMRFSDRLQKIKIIASTFRTILCKDTGTREELKNPSQYAKLLVRPNKESYSRGETVTITVKNNGSKPLEFYEDYRLILQVKSLEKGESIGQIEHDIFCLDKFQEEKIIWDRRIGEKPIETGSYLLVTETYGEILSIGTFMIKN